MRVRMLVIALTVMAAAPVWAQPRLPLASRTVLPAHVMCADQLVPAIPVPTVRIRGPHYVLPHLAMSRGDDAVVPRQPEDGMAIGQRYLIRRLPSGWKAELPREGGYVPIRTLGWVTLTALDDVTAIVHVDFACDAIEPDDYLTPYVEAVLPTPDTALLAPDFSERIQILTGGAGREMFADGDSFSIARGTDAGVTVGARFAIYRDRKDGRPLVHIGEAIVTDPSATSAKLLLLKTTDVVEVTDLAVPRR